MRRRTFLGAVLGATVGAIVPKGVSQQVPMTTGRCAEHLAPGLRKATCHAYGWWHSHYGLGFSVTGEALDDDRYRKMVRVAGSLGKQMARDIDRRLLTGE